MAEIPDAPWIRQAEMYGVPDNDITPDIIDCPVCGKACSTIYAKWPDVFGCENCVDVWDADEWWIEEHRRD